MSTGFNTDIQSILNKAVGQLESLGGSTGSLGTSSGNNFVNSIWGPTQEGQAAVNGNDNQKAQAITNIVQNLLGMLMSLGTKETSKANKEVKQNEKQANTLEKNADKAAQTTEEKVQEIISNIADNTTSISKAMDEIKALGGDKGDIAKALETLEEQLKIIDDNKKILNDGVSSPEAKQKALENLIGASQVINELVASIAEVQKEIETQNGIVENTANNVAGLVEESVNVITNGAQTLQGFIQQGGIQTATTTTIAARGTADVSVGSIATAKGSALSSNLVTATAGQKLLRIGSDRTSAGQTRIKGATENLSALTKANEYTSKEMNNKINEFLLKIDEDKSIIPFLEFGKYFHNKTIEEVMISLYQMVDGGYADNYINQFILVFENLRKRSNEENLHNRYKKMNNLNLITLVGSGYLMLVMLIVIVTVIGEMTNGF